MLVGRDDELSRLQGLIAGARRGEGGALLLHGEAGIGKTALLDAARAVATDATVLDCRGIESESGLSFGALRDLIHPVVDRRDELPGPQQAALAGALALGPPVPGDRLAICIATLRIIEAAAAEGPVLVLVDDMQWLDGPSAECVAYVARRARGAVAVVITARDGHRDVVPADIPSAALGPLDTDDAHALVAGAAPDLAESVRQAITSAADGNPLALVELPATLTAGQRRGTEPLARPLAPGTRFERLYDQRLAQLPPEARTVLLVAAASHTDDLRVLDSACRQLGTAVAEFEPAEVDGLVWVSGGRLRFTHPLVRGAVYHAAPAAERRAAHRALAAGDPGEARAWHLGAAAAGPDDEAADALHEAAGVAAARRAYAIAAQAFERAAELSSDPATAVGRLVAAGAAALSAGRTAHATELAAEACARAGDPLTQAAAQHLKGILTYWSGDLFEAMELLERSADLADGNPAMAAQILADAGFAASAVGDCRRALEIAQRARDLVDESSDPSVRAPVLAILSWALALTGDSVAARPLIVEALDAAPQLDPFSPAVQTILMATNIRGAFEDYEGARDDCLERAAAAREAGSLYALPTPLCVAAHAEWRLGNWDAVGPLCDEALAAAEETGQEGLVPLARVTRARVTAARGNEEATRADGEAALAIVESVKVGAYITYGHGLLGFMALSAGRIDEAIAELEATRRFAVDTSMFEPTIIPWAPDLVEAYVRAGREDDARDVLAIVRRQMKGCPTPGVIAVGHRCEGLLAEPTAFDQHFETAMSHHADSPVPFERARTLLAWGMRLHRVRRRADARERLHEAADLFDSLDAHSWSITARAELRAAGGRRRRQQDEELSAQEERVAVAAGRGATTREIAAEMFLSPKTVEFHLGRAYRKLGIHSRAELSHALAERERAPHP